MFIELSSTVKVNSANIDEVHLLSPVSWNIQDEETKEYFNTFEHNHLGTNYKMTGSTSKLLLVIMSNGRMHKVEDDLKAIRIFSQL